MDNVYSKAVPSYNQTPRCCGRCSTWLGRCLLYSEGRGQELDHGPNLAASRPHSGGNYRFCARLKTDISASNSGLQGRTRSCLTFLEIGRRDESKMVRHDLRRPWRPELKAEMSVFNLAQKRSFPPLCSMSKARRQISVLFSSRSSPVLISTTTCSTRTSCKSITFHQ
jgi:hypothetical protein